MKDLSVIKDANKIIKHAYSRFSELQKCLKSSEYHLTEKERINYVIDFCDDMKKEFKV